MTVSTIDMLRTHLQLILHHDAKVKSHSTRERHLTLLISVLLKGRHEQSSAQVVRSKPVHLLNSACRTWRH